MVSFSVFTEDKSGRKIKRCTSYHVQSILTFIGVKHSHCQQTMDLIAKDNLFSDTEPMSLTSFLSRIQGLLIRMNYSNPRTDLQVAWHIMNRQSSVCILLGGTSGCGKSTLASLLAHRIGITTVLSTDHVRSLLRSFDPQKNTRLLWASSYHAGEPPKKKIDQDHRNSIIEGYEAQNLLLLDTLDKTIAGYNQRNECLVIEGVGLSVESMRILTKKHPNCIPVLIYISNEQKHAERFAIRAKYMTMAPQSNKYINYFGNIRLIQQHLCQNSDLWMIPKINNTNVDKSLAILHSTVVNVLSRMERKGLASLMDMETGKFPVLFEEYSKVYEAAWSSKQILRNIRLNSKDPALLNSATKKPRLLVSRRLDFNDLDHLDDIAWGSLAS
ncbi:hypothetical protein CLU79DRAFT_759555 [Phycomyces nitens]|nr:hypothetical protein CLU79DRAFT_759555 [Phycomyces nitens]